MKHRLDNLLKRSIDLSAYKFAHILFYLKFMLPYINTDMVKLKHWNFLESTKFPSLTHYEFKFHEVSLSLYDMLCLKIIWKENVSIIYESKQMTLFGTTNVCKNHLCMSFWTYNAIRCKKDNLKWLHHYP